MTLSVVQNENSRYISKTVTKIKYFYENVSYASILDCNSRKSFSSSDSSIVAVAFVGTTGKVFFKIIINSL